MGRPSKAPLDLLKTKVWLAEVMRLSGAGNVNQLGELLDDVDTKKMLYRYEKGSNAVSAKMLAYIDSSLKKAVPHFVGGSKAFTVGPASRRAPIENAPLWNALDDSIDLVWEVMLDYDPPLAAQRLLGTPFALRCSFLTVQLFGTADPKPHWHSPDAENQVAKAYAAGDLAVDIDLLTFAIAAWRMAHFVGEAQPMLDYILIGLLDKAAQDVLVQAFPHIADSRLVASIGEDLCTRLYELDMANLARAKEAITDMDHLTSVYPSTMLAQDVHAVQADYQIPFDSQHWYRAVERRSVSTFLKRRGLGNARAAA